MSELRAPQMSVERAEAGPRVVLRIKGEIDIASVAVLRAAIDGAFDSAVEEVCVDLSPTTFMDSQGINLLFESLRRAEQSGQRLTIVAPEGNVRRVLTLTGIENELVLLDSA